MPQAKKGKKKASVPKVGKRAQAKAFVPRPARVRKDFSKIRAIIEIPNLLEVQKRSYEAFLQKDIRPDLRTDTGLQGVFNGVFPINDFKGFVTLEYVSYAFGEPKYTEDECRERGMTYAAPLKVTIRLKFWDQESPEEERRIKKVLESEVYFGELPLMTDTGTFIINGTERVVVSQMHKSPGLFIETQKSKTTTVAKTLYSARLIPYSGSWLDLEYDSKDLLYARIDRKRKFLVTALLQALGLSRQEILTTFYPEEVLAVDAKGHVTRELDLKALAGQKLRWSIVDPKKGDILFKEGSRMTPGAIQKLKDRKLTRVPVGAEEIAGRVLAKDCVHEQTGEVLGEANQAVAEEILQKIIQGGIKEIHLLVTEGPDLTPSLRDTLAADAITSAEEAVVEIYRRLRPGEPPTVETSRIFFENLFFNPKRYDLSGVGRLKLNRRLGLTVPMENRTLTREDIIESLRFLIKSHAEQVPQDDVDHLGNRRVKAVGELLENQFRIGLVRMERAIRERMGIQDPEELAPQDLINAKPVDAAIKEFFGSSQLSQFMDQTNPVSEITHKRRLSALGPGGLTRERAGFEVRDVHPTHYSRICPIETPEGPNIGLITSLSTYARVNQYGFIETPVRKVVGGKVTDEIVYLTADQAEKFVVAQANTPVGKRGEMLTDKVSVRRSGDFAITTPVEVDFMDVSPKQIVSVSTALVPFLEHDDANRALMGSNMQRQAVPLLQQKAPLIGTGMEGTVARDSGVVILAKSDGVVEKVDALRIIVRADSTESGLPGAVEVYGLKKFKRSNQNTCLNQVPIVREGQRLTKGEVIADGAAVDNGELALGRNVLVAFMPWGGYNFEDAILLSERLARDDVFTSIHIEEFEVEARDTKLGKEDITRDIPNVGEEALKNLDESGIIRIAAEVKPGDILVGKVTPKGETQLTPEEKLLRAIFGEKAGDVKDSSLVVPPGIEGTIVDVKVFSRRGAEKDERAKAIEDEEVDKLRRDLQDELKLVDEEERKRLMKLFHGRKAPQAFKDRESGRWAVKRGGTLTYEILDRVEMDGHFLAKVASDEKIRTAAESVREKSAEQKELLKTVYEDKINRLKKGDELPPGVIKLVKVYIAIKRKVSVGDKMAGRHGNKGVVSMILPIEDMPYLPDGTPVDIVLNPLGVPSRMNVGQILETHLGWAAKELGRQVAELARRAEIGKLKAKLKKIYNHGEMDKALEKMTKEEMVAYAEAVASGVPMSTPVFEGATEGEIKEMLTEAGLPLNGKTVLHDGRTGKPFDQSVTVGYIYMMKLHHLVDDKIHARSIGPYSLVTQQPLGGKAQFGGQRFGEMEVWALEAYGAAFTLQEILTVKSDDVVGRTKVYESIVKGRETHQAGIPESFNVLVKELQGLGLDVELLEKKPKEE